jgi:hypothetical protein
MPASEGAVSTNDFQDRLKKIPQQYPLIHSKRHPTPLCWCPTNKASQGITIRTSQTILPTPFPINSTALPNGTDTHKSPQTQFFE